MKKAWTPSDGKTHNQTDHILLIRGWLSFKLDVRFVVELALQLITT
jgi:hypothetical protein